MVTQHVSTQFQKAAITNDKICGEITLPEAARGPMPWNLDKPQRLNEVTALRSATVPAGRLDGPG